MEQREIQLLWTAGQSGVSEGYGKEEFVPGQIVEGLFSHGKEFIEEWMGKCRVAGPGSEAVEALSGSCSL